MTNALIVAVLVLVALGGYYVYSHNITNMEKKTDDAQAEFAVKDEVIAADESAAVEEGPSVIPITHASMVWTWNNVTIYVDPVGGPELYEDLMAPDVVLLTDIHGDHLNLETLSGVITPNSVLVAPQAVLDELPTELGEQVTLMANGETIEQNGFSIEAVAMYNLPESDDSYHVKGRGNGYVVERNGHRVYIAGDTAGVPEMRAQKDIAMAFVPMNLPYTMSIEEAADAVLEFAPKSVIPYHYRSPDGLSDVEEFKRIVTSQNPDIQVLLLDWYPSDEETEE